MIVLKLFSFLKEIFGGFKFGMILQLAVGPVCLFIFNTALTSGVSNAILAALTVAIVDGLYILLAVKGIAAVLKNDKLKKVFKIAGGTVLMIFGLSTVLGVFDINLIPHLSTDTGSINSNAVVYALVLTLSNPLTILFWAGIFGAKIVDEKLEDKQIVTFSIGCILSTVFFLILIAILGAVFGMYFPKIMINILNILVGIFIVYFGVKFLIKK